MPPPTLNYEEPCIRAGHLLTGADGRGQGLGGWGERRAGG